MNKNLLRITFLFSSLLISTSCWSDKHEDTVPAAPISATEFEGWTNSFRLDNGVLEVVVVPDTGRIAYLGLSGGENLLRLDESLKGQQALPDAPDFWFNFGGDWFWPVAQNRWADFQGGDWPPSRLMDGRPWHGKAWKTADGSDTCLLTQEYGDPLHIKVSRHVRLDKERGSVSIKQRIERTAESDIPITPWNITQLAKAEEIVIPIEGDSRFEGGYDVLNFGPPSPEELTTCDGAVVYQAGKGEHKLGSDSPRGWIAARKGDVLVVETATPHDPEANYPDGGCTVELYSNAGLGYSEIETLGPEKVLGPGESIENTLRIDCYKLVSPVTGCDLAKKVRTLIGEIDPAPAVPVEAAP